MSTKSNTPPEERKEQQLPKGVTQGDLKAFIAKNGKVFPIYVEQDGKTFCALVKKPSLVVISAATSAASANGDKMDPFIYTEVIYNSCKLMADPEIEADEEMLQGVRNQTSLLFKSAQTRTGEAFV